MARVTEWPTDAKSEITNDPNPIDIDTLTVDDIPWQLQPDDDDEAAVRLSLFDAKDLYSFCVSQQDDVRILRTITSELLASGYDLVCQRRKARTRIAQLLTTLQDRNAEIQRLRSRLRALGEG